MDIPDFNTKTELYDFLIKNKDVLIVEKKASIKHADGINLSCDYYNEKGETIKANNPVTEIKDELKTRLIINTTNIMDSHKDVHLPGLWAKSLKENNKIMHLQEHVMSYKTIISSGSDLNAYAKTYSWKNLGFEFEGKTQALVFDSVVKQSRNAFMFDQYKQGYVENHSVGMQYVQLELAINDKDYKEEKAVWDKYFPEIVNQSTAKSAGYFWAVREAKVIEGSAVPLGSNYATPTLENNMKVEPSEDTHKDIEPSEDTLTVEDFKNEFKKHL